MARDDNIITFMDTEERCKKNARLKESLAKSISTQKLILEGDSIGDVNRSVYESEAKVVVSHKRTYEAASAYKDSRVVVHNFASATQPGGGVVNGANAQEECLCRVSTLYFCLNTPEMWDGFYTPHRAEHNPLHNDDVIFTPDVTVFKTDTAKPERMGESEWFDVDIITCAAPNLRENPSNQMNSGDGQNAVKLSYEEQVVLHEKRLRRILDVAVAAGEEVLILGAFGCGAFQNDPQAVAEAARNIMADYLHAFEIIEFAIYCSPRDEQNYGYFERAMNSFLAI